MTDPRSQPPEEDAAAQRRREKHAQILTAAIDVFAERGFHNARIADVAKKAGVADGTIYLYFRNKEELLLTIFEEKMGQLIAGVRAAIAPVSDPMEKLRVFARHHFEQVAAQRTLAEVLQVELRLSNKFLKEYRPEKLWEYLGLISSFVKEGQEQGTVRPELDAYVVSWAFFGSLDELAMQWILQRRPRFSLESTAETVADVFIRGILVPSSQQ
jgi:TetR/AcrR family fatty acid metabolism transcriptional regulator